LTAQFAQAFCSWKLLSGRTGISNDQNFYAMVKGILLWKTPTGKTSEQD